VHGFALQRAEISEAPGALERVAKQGVVRGDQAFLA